MDTPIMFVKEYTCPSCAAPIQQKKPGARMLVCIYCGQTSYINADSLQAVGEQAPLIDYGSSFSIGKMGTFEGKEFMVLGRLRYSYEDGFWDEWYVNSFEGEKLWIQEDDGQFVVYFYSEALASIPEFESIQVGSKISVSPKINAIFVSSKSEAQIQGGEGELPFRVSPGMQANFIDGIMKGRAVSIELLPGEPLVFIGKPVELDEFKLRD